MRNLRAGVIGLGAMGRNHLRVLMELSGVDVVGVSDPSPAGSIPSGDVAILNSIEELLQLDLDYCVLSTPTSTHEELGLILASAGIHALIEKPLALSALSAQRLCNAFDSAGLVASVGHIERFNPALQEARLKVEQGVVGEVIQVATRRQSPFPERISDVGVILDLATHDVDLTAWVAQAPYVEVAGHVAYRTERGLEDLVSVSGLLEGGIVVSNLVNWLSPFKERRTTITGSDGTLVVDTVMSDLTLYENGLVKSQWEDLAKFRGVTEGAVHRFAIGKSEPLVAEHEHFRDAVLGLTKNRLPLSDGVCAVVVAEAVALSARQRRQVFID